jgi:hypothetical protein
MIVFQGLVIKNILLCVPQYLTAMLNVTDAIDGIPVISAPYLHFYSIQSEHYV